MSGGSSYVRGHVRAMKAYVPGEQPRDKGLIKLNTNENPYPPSPKVTEALRTLDPDTLRLYPDPVSMELRREVAALHGCTPEQVLIANGSDEVLALCTRALVEEGKGIGWFEPSYSLYPVLADIADVPHEPVPLAEDFTWVDPVCRNAGLFFITNPNAPTGMLHDKARIASFCRSFHGVVLIDEAYGDFAREHCADLALTMPNVLVSRSFSKSFSLAGIRLGYVIGDAGLIEALHTIKDSYNVNILTQVLGLAALRDLDTMRSNVGRIKATRQRFSDALEALGFHVYPSETNFVWVKPPSPLGAEGVFRALREKRILTRYFPGGKTGDCLRITIGTDEQMDQCLTVLRGIEGMPG